MSKIENRAKERLRKRQQSAAASSDVILSSCRYILYAIVLFHFIALTPLTLNLDEIKRLSLWIGGSLCFVLSGILLYLKIVRLPSKPVLISFGACLLTLLLSAVMMNDAIRFSSFEQIRNWFCFAGFVSLAALTHSVPSGVKFTGYFWTVITLILCGFGFLLFAGFILYDQKLDQFTMNLLLFSTSFKLDSGSLKQLVVTLTSPENIKMHSTILNTQFFGNLLLLMIPPCIITIWMGLPVLRKGDSSTISDQDKVHPFWGFAGIIAVFLAIVCLGLTFSKISVIALPFALGIAILGIKQIAGGRPFNLPAFPVLLGLGTITILTVLFFIKDDISNQVSGLSNSTNSRLIIWEGAYEIWKSSPLFGTGPGSFVLLFPEFRSPDYHMDAISNVTLWTHNILLDILVQTGLIGLCAIIAFAVFLLKDSFKQMKGSTVESTRVMTLGLIASLVGIMIAGFATPVLFWPIGQVFLAMVVGQLVGMTSQSLAPEEETETLPSAAKPAGAVLTALAVIFLVVNTSYSIRYFEGTMAHKRGIEFTERGTVMISDHRKEVVEFNRGELLKAIENFNIALEKNPYFLTSYYRKAHAMNRLASLYEIEYQQIYQANVQNIEDQRVHAALIEPIKKNIEYQTKTQETYEELQKFAPNYSEVHFNHSILSLTIGNMKMRWGVLPLTTEEDKERLFAEIKTHYENATESAKQAAKMSNKITVWKILGEVHRQAASAYSPDSPEALEHNRQAGLAFLRTAQLPLTEVTQSKNQTIQEEQQRFESANLAPQLLAKAKAWDELGEAVETLLPLFPSMQKSAMLGSEGYARAGLSEKADAMIARQLDLNPASPEYYLLRLQLSVSMDTFTSSVPIEEQIRIIETLQENLDEFMNNNQKQIFENIKQRDAAS